MTSYYAGDWHPQMNYSWVNPVWYYNPMEYKYPSTTVPNYQITYKTFTGNKAIPFDFTWQEVQAGEPFDTDPDPMDDRLDHPDDDPMLPAKRRYHFEEV